MSSPFCSYLPGATTCEKCGGTGGGVCPKGTSLHNADTALLEAVKLAKLEGWTKADWEDAVNELWSTM